MSGRGVLLYPRPVRMDAPLDALAALAADGFGGGALDGTEFAFASRDGRRVRTLRWTGAGWEERSLRLPPGALRWRRGGCVLGPAKPAARPVPPGGWDVL